MGTAAAWSLRRGEGYPRLVYTWRTVEQAYPFGSAAYDTWLDPRRRLLRRQPATGSAGSLGIARDGLWYDAAGKVTALPSSVYRDDLALARAVGRADYAGFSAVLLARRLGTPVLTRDDGALTLRVSLRERDPSARTVLWMDASTGAPLRLLTTFTNGDESEQRYSRYRRIPPGVLPAGFFDLPHTGVSLWDRAAGWLHAHIDR